MARTPARQLVAGGKVEAIDHSGVLSAKLASAVTDLTTPAALELSGSQWAIRLPDGRVMPTGSGQERTERDAEWENNNRQGLGACTVLVRDTYMTPWRPMNDAPATTLRQAWATLLYRLVYDPDGRLIRLKVRRSF